MTRESIQFIINIWDPKDIIYYDEEGDQGTCNYDEYDAEVDNICKCLALSGGTCSTERLAEILRVVFAEYFGEEEFLWAEKPREGAKTFEQVAEEILHDTITVGTNIFDVEPKPTSFEDYKRYKDFLKELAQAFGGAVKILGADQPTVEPQNYIPAEDRILAQLFNEEVHAELVRYIEERKAALARLKILQETYREEDFDTNLPLTFRSLVEMLFGDSERGREVAEKILAAYDMPEEILQNGLEPLLDCVRPYGILRPEAKWLFNISQLVKENYGGKLPETFSALFEVPNLETHIICNIRHELIKNSDADYDKHVLRVANRTKIDEDDTSLEDEHKLFWHGQKICKDEPKCSICPLLSCPSRC